ncbi:hypothetical protein TevJSym_ap00340 [endosymbiont of Tevnia jerichonana (vent Tica)]|uniref:Uncharacterized protein n=1 Tax=endosymbiont of Tevnia jerichonana (vent Tica) TaxID=1049564 RepID=G2FG94_9GAMM|nr:hypothetical protein TevJSym_ap00340 [endosymbiont of Tevnia jerichonana (vent Tica)]
MAIIGQLILDQDGSFFDATHQFHDPLILQPSLVVQILTQLFTS